MDQPQNSGQHDPLKPNATPPSGEPGGPHPDSVPEAPPLTPTAWLMQNGVYILLFLAGVAWIYKNFGVDGLWRAFLVVIGLSFVVFIHELGHFLAAKWCDVHVTTFSLGFGPAVPGCSFVRGETTYMVGILPLGGYVAMVGEGPEADEDESYPRSFKNKSVAQRMVIISAGVIMNVILGAACFIFVYMAHGRERPMPVIAALEGGSPAWRAGVRSGGDITQIGGIQNPYYDDIRLEVAISQAGQKIPITFQPRDGKTEAYTAQIEPRRENEDIYPVIGVVPTGPLRLLQERARDLREIPAVYNSAGAYARVVNFQPGDVLLEARLEGVDTVVPLEPGLKGVATLTRLFREHPTATITVKVRRAGQAEDATEMVKIEPKGIDFDDQIIGTTDPGASDTFAISKLPQDPLRSSEVYWPDPLAYRQRLRDLAGKPIALDVQRGDDTVRLLVPPSTTWVLPGVRLSMGQIAAVRDDSEASKAELLVAESSSKVDILSRVEAIRFDKNGQQTTRIFENVDPKEGQPAPGNVVELDPLRLPFDLEQFASAPERDPAKKVQVKLTVLREDKTTHKDRKPTAIERVLQWDDSWNNQQDVALNRTSPLTIPQLGLAYRVETIIDHVREGSPGAVAGLKKGDRIDKVTFRDMGKLRSDEGTWGSARTLQTERYSGQKAFDAGANLGYLLQQQDSPQIKLTLYRDGKEETVELTATRNEDWYNTSSQGFIFLMYDFKLVKAETVWAAMTAGINDTTRMIKSMYLNLSSLLSGRISTRTLGGPIEIAAQTFTMAEDPYVLIFWLGIISINLAVVNFLPIPVLDGGHMVFLIYEWLRGRPPSQMVQAAATYVGLAIILSLMVFVVYLDVKRRFFGM